MVIRAIMSSYKGGWNNHQGWVRAEGGLLGLGRSKERDLGGLAMGVKWFKCHST